MTYERLRYLDGKDTAAQQVRTSALLKRRRQLLTLDDAKLLIWLRELRLLGPMPVRGTR